MSNNVFKLSFRFFANLHLHAGGRSFTSDILAHPGPARNACFLGNIGNPKTAAYQEFLKATSDSFDRVFVVNGRCEYSVLSNGCIAIDRYTEDLCRSLGNCHFLQETSVRIDKHLIVTGGTFRHGGQQTILDACRDEFTADQSVNPGTGRTLLLSHYSCELSKALGGFHWAAAAAKEGHIIVDGYVVAGDIVIPF